MKCKTLVQVSVLAMLAATTGACELEDSLVEDTAAVADDEIDADEVDADEVDADVLDELLQPPEVAMSGCQASPGYYPYLDGDCNGKRVKTYPAKLGTNAQFRGFTCPNRGAVPAGYLPAQASVQAIKPHLDTKALAAINLPAGLQATLINIRRDAQGRPYYRYFGTTNHSEARESWSTSKFMAAAAAGAKIREASSHMLGLTSTTSSGHALSDLVTWIHNYDKSGSLESNALARYFLNVAGRDYARGLVQT